MNKEELKDKLAWAIRYTSCHAIADRVQRVHKVVDDHVDALDDVRYFALHTNNSPLDIPRGVYTSLEEIVDAIQMVECFTPDDVRVYVMVDGAVHYVPKAEYTREVKTWRTDL